MSGVFYEGESSEDSSSSDDSSYNESCSEESKEASAGDIEFSSENEDSDAMLEELSNWFSGALLLCTYAAKDLHGKILLRLQVSLLV